jgi:hypothetical protein
MPTTNAMEGLKVVEIIENVYKQNQFFREKRGVLTASQA